MYRKTETVLEKNRDGVVQKCKRSAKAVNRWYFPTVSVTVPSNLNVS